MSEHKVAIKWKRETDDFSYRKYDRSHEWMFEGGTRLEASAAPEFLGKKQLVNPEEALAASLASCHMLTFLSIASRKGFVIDSYKDEAVAVLEKNEKGKLAITKVFLKPEIAFSGDNAPPHDEIMNMHHASHDECFIANSVLTEIILEPAL